jgi:hypothetical protein
MSLVAYCAVASSEAIVLAPEGKAIRAMEGPAGGAKNVYRCEGG